MTNLRGPLTKKLALDKAGKLVGEPTGNIVVGFAKRQHIGTLEEFTRLISSFEPYEAIALGRLREDLPDDIPVNTKASLDGLAKSGITGIIARSAEFIGYKRGQPAIVLIDVDTKGIPKAIRARVEAMGGLGRAL